MSKKKTRHLEIAIAILLGLFIVMFLIVFPNGFARKNATVSEIDEPADTNYEINYEDIKVVSGKYFYEDENFTSSFGIDVSTFQDEIDWNKVKNDSVEFAYIRIGRRGATTGLLYEDDLFEANYEGAKKAGLKIGVYFFSQAINETEARQEADWVINKLKGKEIDLPIAYDCEEVFLENELSRVIFLDKEDITKNALAFCRRLEEKNYHPIIYTYQFWADNYYDMEQLSSYPIWFAQYDVDEPKLDYPISIWQYSDKGTINGITTPVDLNIMFIKKK